MKKKKAPIKLKTFRVMVERCVTQTSSVNIEAETEDDAADSVLKLIEKNAKLSLNEAWGEASTDIDVIDEEIEEVIS